MVEKSDISFPKSAIINNLRYLADALESDQAKIISGAMQTDPSGYREYNWKITMSTETDEYEFTMSPRKENMLGQLKAMCKQEEMEKK